MKRKWTVKTTTYNSPFGPVDPPVVTYNGRYWTTWFMAKPVANRMPGMMALNGYTSTAEVVPITPEIEDRI